ncbi:hypothetical protein CW704_01800 [Candidatus Bathyarchaeota archaeon]|nr:MAG: hypothetical protein CW704_01800 [Candidatus Bathyarchaeota archaeon]
MFCSSGSITVGMAVSDFEILFPQCPLIISIYIYFSGDLKVTKSRQAATLFLLSMLLFSAAPFLVFAAEDDATDQTEDAVNTKPNDFAIALRAQRMLEIANRTAMRIEFFIEKIYDNETLIGVLEDDGLLSDLEGNVALFRNATDLLDEASAAINASDYEGAIANVTEAMKTFREVYRAIHRIIGKHVAALNNSGIARGLIVAMQRALDRIERIEMLPLINENVTSLLNEAKQYLNITAAKEMLAEGNVTEVAHNLARGNQLISQAYQLLRKEARMMIWKRMDRFLNNMERSSRRILVKIALAKKMGVNVSAVLEELGYKNETEFKENLLKMIMAARGKAENIKKTLLELQKISQTFWRMDRALTKHLHQWRSHESWGGQSQSQSQSQKQNQTENKPGNSGRGLGKGGSSGNRHGWP